jgi:hypothetical protein
MQPSFVRFLVRGVLVAACASCVASARADDPAVLMLRRGVWDGGVGSHDVPAPLAALNPRRWPSDGWHRLRLLRDRIEIEPVAVDAGRQPEFLRSIVDQVERRDASDLPRPEEPNEIYLRAPATPLREGRVETIVFRNGTSALVPQLDYRYELELGRRKIAFSVQNGLRTSHGSAYGSGARYLIEYDGETYEYLLGEFGWSSRIEAIADLDGDGKPDFIIKVDGNNSGDEVVLLSSRARSGRNAATARLHVTGC